MKYLVIALLMAALAATLPASAETRHVIASVGQQIKGNSREIGLRYIGLPVWGPLRPTLGVSRALNGSGHVGAGFGFYWQRGREGAFVRLGTIAGIHKRGNGRDLGGPIMFRSALDLGYRTARGVEFGLGVDHRSSARLYRPNPGLDTVYVFVGRAWN